MKRFLSRSSLFAASVALVCIHSGLCAPVFEYPKTPTTNQVDDYFGTKVADPYRWLEDEASPQTRAWIAAENKLTFAYLDKIPERPKIHQRLIRLWNYERYGVPVRQGNRYFYSKNNGLQNQSVLYVADSLEADPKTLLDPNTLSPDGTVALSGMAISEDGNWLAYGIAKAGSDWQEWKVRDVRTGLDGPDDLQWVKFSGAVWSKDGRGFFYCRYDAPPPGARLQALNQFQKLYFHRLGAAQAEDELIYHRPDQKEWGFSPHLTEDGRFLVIHVWKGTDTKNGVFYQDLTKPGSKVVELLKDFDASYSFIGNDGARFYFQTDLKAPKGRVIAIDLENPAENWRTIIPESTNTLESVRMFGGEFLAIYLQDAHSTVRFFSIEGSTAGDLPLPGLGSVSGFTGERSHPETFFSFSSFTMPGTIYHYDLGQRRSTIFRQPKVAFDPNQFATEQVFYPARGGTRVPMFLVHQRGLKLDGQNPTLLYAYGGFRLSQRPRFSPADVAWLEMGGVFAVANLRGGGEYGEAWHRAGMLEKKQTVFDDFIAAAEWLIAQHYTSPSKLAISGRSNGGLLVGACLTQRPELFGATLPAVGVMDMLRFHKFTIGWAWVSEYGSSDNPEQFQTLRRYSPLHRIKPGTRYPATFITTADHDDRVVPGHSFKFAAALQAAQGGDKPIFIRIETKAGHGGGKPTMKLIDETADEFAFLVRELQIELPAGDF